MRSIADWFDEKTLMELVSPDVFVRGAAGAEHGSVQILEYDDQHLRSRVEDTEVYEATFDVRDGELTWSCTCGEATEHPCHHLIASAFATWPTEVPDDEAT